LNYFPINDNIDIKNKNQSNKAKISKQNEKYRTNKNDKISNDKKIDTNNLYNITIKLSKNKTIISDNINKIDMSELIKHKNKTLKKLTIKLLKSCKSINEEKSLEIASIIYNYVNTN
jgi:hypothetical protein